MQKDPQELVIISPGPDSTSKKNLILNVGDAASCCIGNMGFPIIAFKKGDFPNIVREGDKSDFIFVKTPKGMDLPIIKKDHHSGCLNTSNEFIDTGGDDMEKYDAFYIMTNKGTPPLITGFTPNNYELGSQLIGIQNAYIPEELKAQSNQYKKQQILVFGIKGSTTHERLIIRTTGDCLLIINETGFPALVCEKGKKCFEIDEELSIDYSRNFEIMEIMGSNMILNNGPQEEITIGGENGKYDGTIIATSKYKQAILIGFSPDYYEYASNFIPAQKYIISTLLGNQR